MNSGIYPTFDDFFRVATGGYAPYPYQRHLAGMDDLPQVLRIPTGLGKTEAVVLAWLWRRKNRPAETPRRLVYCLPMRVLVEQTRDRIRAMLQRLGSVIDVSVLMGGEDDDRWDLYPEREAILVGTQDMLLSRALNRGYGMSRFRWPMHFGLLNNDCLWVMDEVQLMGAGLPTTLQLEAFRGLFVGAGPHASLWMSATLTPEALTTVDAPPPERLHSLSDDDRQYPDVLRRVDASKPVRRSKNIDSASRAAEVISAHRPGTLTLAIVNTVDRASDLFLALRKRGTGQADLRLVHSRFRPFERHAWLSEFLSIDAPMPQEGRIVVSTQIVEAGVDLSAATLFTEVCPWSSMVQRFGRCNRRGEYGPDRAAGAEVVVWDVEDARPYEAADVEFSINCMESLPDVGPGALSLRQISVRSTPMTPVLRRKDFLDLFDTTPDLTGNDVDVQPFIREGKDTDVLLFWRLEPPDEKGRLRPPPVRAELCPVPIGAARDFIKKAGIDAAFVFDATDGQWNACREELVRPGREILILGSAGGYEATLGFSRAAKRPVSSVPVERNDIPPDAHGEDPASARAWRSIADHTDRVVEIVCGLTDALLADDELAGDLLSAARLHDWGKAHAAFQGRLADSARPPEWQGRLDVAKAPDPAWSVSPRRHFRHELAGALACLRVGYSDRVAYLVACHHGKVRLTLRSLAGETLPTDRAQRFCRGIWDGDELPSVPLGGGEMSPPVVLSLESMEMGLDPDQGASWADRMLAVLREEGPLRLAWMEAILRAADARASADDSEVLHG